MSIKTGIMRTLTFIYTIYVIYNDKNVFDDNSIKNTKILILLE
jgi:hypothetical protein